MCERCRKAHKEAMEQVNAELDEQGVPEDSLVRGFADIEIACQNHPTLMMLMKMLYPTSSTLVS